MSRDAAKESLDRIIRKVKIYSYKPIQIAEILHRHRTADLALDDLENYRIDSRHWRDAVSSRLVGTTSASSSRYQDNLFDKNAVPPDHIRTLAKANDDGAVEAYVYAQLREKWNDVIEVNTYLRDALDDPNAFEASEFVELFEESALTKCTDKMYEIMAYALLAATADDVNAEVRVEAGTPSSMLEDSHSALFGGTTTQELVVERVGTANAADSGVDIRTNFGPIVQVKHATLTAANIEDICEESASNHVIIVCDSVSTELTNRPASLQSVLTKEDIITQYNALRQDEQTFRRVISRMQSEVETEFPLVDELEAFVTERGYDRVAASDPWSVTFGFEDDRASTDET